MSVMDILKKDIGGKKKDATPVDGTVVAASPDKPSKPSKAAKGAAATLAAAPRANLMPPEIGQNHRRKAARRGMRLAVIGVAFLVALGIGGAWAYSYLATQSLEESQAESQTLLLEQQKYSEVQRTLDGIAAGEAAVEVGGSTDIDWQPYLDQLQATLPEGVLLTAVTVDSADAQTPFAQSNIPLEGVRIATLTFAAKSPTLPEFPDWINRLSSLPGFTDASPGSVSLSDGIYTASVTMHINSNAYSNKYVESNEEAGK